MSRELSTAPGQKCVSLTPSDSTDFTVRPRAVYVGGAGDIVFVNDDDTTVTLVGVLVGTLLPISPKRINSTSTTATNLVGIL